MSYNRRRSNIDDDLLQAIKRNQDDSELLYILQMPVDKRLAIAAGILFLVLIAIFALAFVFVRPPGDRSSLADITITPTPRPTRTAVPTVVAVPTQVPTAVSNPTGIAVGVVVEVAETNGGLNVRESPDVNAKVVAALADGARLIVIEGPVTQGEFTWWRVEGQGIKGWCVQRYLKPAQ